MTMAIPTAALRFATIEKKGVAFFAKSPIVLLLKCQSGKIIKKCF